jgi:anti-anti-sigma regulatory factor
MRELSYIDVRGIKALEDAGLQAQSAGQRFMVVSASSLIRKMFSILQFDGRVQLVGTLDDALRLLGRQSGT